MRLQASNLAFHADVLRGSSRVLFAGRLRLNPTRRKNSFCSYKFNHKNFFDVGFTNRSATTSFSELKSINPYMPAETVQRSLQNQGTYFYRVKPQEFFSFSRFYFRRYISLKSLQTKLFNRSDQGQARRYAQCLSFGDIFVCIVLSFSSDFYHFCQFSFCFASFSSCLKEFHKRSSGHFARSPQIRENLL